MIVKLWKEEIGVTLVELIVVLSAIAVLVLALGFSYRGWIGKYRIENQIREIHTDLMNARVRAMEMKRMHFADFPSTTTFRISMDDSNGVAKVPDGDFQFQQQLNPNVVTANTDTTLPGFPKTFQDAIIGGGTITFDDKGVISAGATTISVTLPADVTPDYDCIRVFETRINLGKMNGVTCDAK